MKKIDWQEFEAHIELQIIEAGGLPMPGAKKAAQVKKAAIAWLDKAIEPKNPIAEAASDIAIRTLVALIGGLIDKKHAEAKRRGLVR